MSKTTKNKNTLGTQLKYIYNLILIFWSIYACQFENENEIENVVEIKIIIANCKRSDSANMWWTIKLND